jgi:hypothetical protein
VTSTSESERTQLARTYLTDRRRGYVASRRASDGRRASARSESIDRRWSLGRRAGDQRGES